MKNNTLILIVIAFALTAVAGFIWQKSASSPYDTLAQCIADSGATFYGAYWCSHCNDQKQMFGTAADMLPYVECSEEGTRKQLPICNDANITGYPTWEFADGERATGVLTREALAEKTSCSLPE